MLATRVLRAAHGGPKPNITGFNIRAFKEATGQPRYDPWERTLETCFSEAWRYQGPFTRWNRFKGALPGFGTASVAFAGYCAYEYFFLDDGHHGDGHGSEGHH
ncbi:NADH dehydrogenase (ubiquinone) 1 beta subcomplex subunit [Paramyrothecium foliicola]|nr:NADH dehydrogenase (ubiquinone) 1 beta subcomplex subunit [Paramyrothecium foliicola]